MYSCNVNCLGSIEASDTYIQILKHPKLVNRCLSCMSAFVKDGMAQTLGSLSGCLCVRVWPVFPEGLDGYRGHVHGCNHKAVCT